jgi:hypothetical protein
MKQPQTKIITEDYYECKRCNISSEHETRMCPCPRGGCEAEVKGKKVTTIEIKMV